MNNQVRGELFIATQDSQQIIFYKQVNAWRSPQDEDKVMGLETGDLQESSLATPDYLHTPSFIEPIENVDAKSSTLSVIFKDQLHKTLPLDTAYEVTVALLYIEKHPDVEKLSPAKQKEIYDRAIRLATSGFEGAKIEVEGV